jgi:hypothetical protein
MIPFSKQTSKYSVEKAPNLWATYRSWGMCYCSSDGIELCKPPIESSSLKLTARRVMFALVQFFSETSVFWQKLIRLIF